MKRLLCRLFGHPSASFLIDTENRRQALSLGFCDRCGAPVDYIIPKEEL